MVVIGDHLGDVRASAFVSIGIFIWRLLLISHRLAERDTNVDATVFPLSFSSSPSQHHSFTPTFCVHSTNCTEFCLVCTGFYLVLPSFIEFLFLDSVVFCVVSARLYGVWTGFIALCLAGVRYLVSFTGFYCYLVEEKERDPNIWPVARHRFFRVKTR